MEHNTNRNKATWQQNQEIMNSRNNKENDKGNDKGNNTNEYMGGNKNINGNNQTHANNTNI